MRRERSHDESGGYDASLPKVLSEARRASGVDLRNFKVESGVVVRHSKIDGSVGRMASKDIQIMPQNH